MPNWIRNHVWPWTRIAILESHLSDQIGRNERISNFADACLAYLDQVEPDARHVHMGGQLWIIRAESTSMFTQQDITVKEPRISFKLEGFDA